MRKRLNIASERWAQAEAADLFALGAVELSSIARGVLTLDALIKQSPVLVLAAEATSPGKYLILLAGEVDEVGRALSRAIDVGGDAIIDDVLLPGAHPQMGPRLAGRDPVRRLTEGSGAPAIGIVETYSAPSLLGAIDSALKTGETWLVDLHLLAGIGGKATGIVAGDVESVRVGIAAASSFARARESLVGEIVIAQPDPATLPFLE